MPFVRRKAGQVLVVHNRRGEDSSVQQDILHRFASPAELRAVVEGGGFAEWRASMTWRYPDLRWSFDVLRARLAIELAQWDEAPSGSVVRRGKKISKLAEELSEALSHVSPARPADAEMVASSRMALAELDTSIRRLLGPAQHKEETLMSYTSDEADELFDGGMEHWWAGDRRAACREFRKALKRDPQHADAHNHIGIDQLDRGRIKDAARSFERAIEGGAVHLQRERGLVEWGWLENRPYLRALANLALVRMRQKRYEEALTLYEQLLTLNPNDNQGIRFVLGQACHHIGRLDDAIAAYERDLAAPDSCYGLALALHDSGRTEDAALALLEGFALNRYIPPMLLGEPWERLRGWHGTSMADAEWAGDYVGAMGAVWRNTPGSAEFLKRWWHAPEVHQWRATLDDLMVRMEAADREERMRMLRQLNGLQAQVAIRKLACEVDPELVGLHRLERPRVAALDEVRITRDVDAAIIEYADERVESVRLVLGTDVSAMSDAAILARHNDVVEAQQRLRMEYEHIAVEVPPGRPQIEYRPEAEQWTPRGDVLRCVVHDHDLSAQIQIDDHLLTLQEFGRMLTTYSGWGMRIAFVPDDELTDEPNIEVREPSR